MEASSSTDRTAGVLGVPGVRFGLAPTANAAFMNSVESGGSTGNPVNDLLGFLLGDQP